MVSCGKGSLRLAEQASFFIKIFINCVKMPQTACLGSLGAALKKFKFYSGCTCICLIKQRCIFVSIST